MQGAAASQRQRRDISVIVHLKLSTAGRSYDDFVAHPKGLDYLRWAALKGWTTSGITLPLIRYRMVRFHCVLAPRLPVSVAFLAAACSDGIRAGDGPGAEVRNFTGAHTRVVWVQGDGTDPEAEGTQLILMGFDTDDGKGERVILGERRSISSPG